MNQVAQIKVEMFSPNFYQISNHKDCKNVVFNFLQAHRHLFKTAKVSPVATCLILEIERLPKFVDYVKKNNIEVVHAK